VAAPPTPPPPATVAAAPVITSRTHFTAPGGQPETRRAVGVGERLTFTSTVAGSWRAGINASPADATTFEWTAPDTAQSVQVTCTAGGQTGSLTIEVVAPNWVTAENAGDLDVSSHGHARAGMKARFVYHPMHVSFAGIEAREEQGPATSIYGYWLRSSASTLHHWPGGPGRNGEFIGLNQRNRDAGWDEVSRYGCRGPWPPEGGGFDWVIPVFYRLVGGGPERRAGTIVQYHRMDADGTIRLRKGDAVVRGERPS